MSNPVHLLEPDVAAAAAAIANARSGRRGAPAVANVLALLPQKLLDDVVEDARAVLAALRSADAAIVAPRRQGALCAADASVLRLETGAATVLILARSRDGRACAALSAIAAGESVIDHDDGAQDLWAAIAARLASPAAEPTPTPAEPERRP